MHCKGVRGIRLPVLEAGNGRKTRRLEHITPETAVCRRIQSKHLVYEGQQMYWAFGIKKRQVPAPFSVATSGNMPGMRK